MRILAAMAAATFLIAPVPEGHVVTLRIDTVAPGQPAKVDVKSSVPGLHLGSSSASASNQLSVNTPVSIVVDANVDGVMIDAQNGTAVRVSFEQGGSARELALKIVGSRMVLRRNMDGDLVPGSRMGGPGRD
jgi:hypothetical protein